MQIKNVKNHWIWVSCLSTLSLAMMSLAIFSLVMTPPDVYGEENMPQATQDQDQTEAVTPAQIPTPTTEETPAAEETPAEASQSPATSPNVVRALLTSAIVDKEPADDIESINKDKGRIYFFTEFSGLEGKVIKHRWEYHGKVMAEVNFNVGSSQWRCYSSKNLLPEWTGSWTVSVIGDDDQVLAEKHFEVTD